MKMILCLFAILDAGVQGIPFRVCIIGKDSDVKLAALTAVEHLNSASAEALPHQASSLNLSVSATVYDQGSKQDVFARGTACINDGADIIIGQQERCAIIASDICAIRSCVVLPFSNSFSLCAWPALRSGSELFSNKS